MALERKPRVPRLSPKLARSIPLLKINCLACQEARVDLISPGYEPGDRLTTLLVLFATLLYPSPIVREFSIDRDLIFQLTTPRRRLHERPTSRERAIFLRQKYVLTSVIKIKGKRAREYEPCANRRDTQSTYKSFTRLSPSRRIG